MLIFKRFRSVVAFGAHEHTSISGRLNELLDKNSLQYFTRRLDGKDAVFTVESQLKTFGFKGKVSQTALCMSSDPDQALMFLGLGKQTDDPFSNRDNIRKAGASLSRTLYGSLKDGDIDRVEHGTFGDAQSFSEGYYLGKFSFDKYKQKSVSKNIETHLLGNDGDIAWQQGKVLAQAQNWARYLMELPANAKTPRKFVDAISEEVRGIEGISVVHRNEEWIREKAMNCFLAVSQGSVEPPVLLEIHYDGTKSTKEIDTVLVGKGVTFDSGGISIKPSAGMGLMKGDMGGAAVSVAVLKAVAELKLPVKISAVIPLCENMPSGTATRPGDIVQSMNGKYVEIDNTDAEGRLILADALTYVCREIKPQNIIDIATLTGAMDVALGSAYTGVFSNSDRLVDNLVHCGRKAGDPFWRMPIHEKYRKQIKSTVADLRNVGGRSAGSCTAAAFLEEFVEGTVNWAHLDIAGVMHSDSHDGYNVKGMSGRPVRSLVEFFRK